MYKTYVYWSNRMSVHMYFCSLINSWTKLFTIIKEAFHWFRKSWSYLSCRNGGESRGASENITHWHSNPFVELSVEKLWSVKFNLHKSVLFKFTKSLTKHSLLSSRVCTDFHMVVQISQNGKLVKEMKSPVQKIDVQPQW